MMIHQRRRAGASATMRNGTVVHYGAFGGHRDGRHRDRVTRESGNLIDLSGQLKLSREISIDGQEVVSVAGELDIATAQQAYAYLSDVIEHGREPVSVDLGGLTFCDASGLSVLARVATHAKQAGRQLMLISARPSLLRIMRITGLDSVFPELGAPASALAHRLS